MPFRFYTRITQVELLDKEAKNVEELLEGIKTVSSFSIYHHTHHYLEQHRYFSPEYSNDFSYWITHSLGLRALGEKIASIDIVQFKDIEGLRQKFIEILSSYLDNNTSNLRNSLPKEKFRFLSSRIFILPTHFYAHNLAEFIDCLSKVTIHSVYFHICEARLRLKRETNDFSLWLKDQGYHSLASKISRLDPYTYTLEGLRHKIIDLIKKESGIEED